MSTNRIIARAKKGQGVSKKITPTELRLQAHELIRTGKMPSLKRVLEVVAEVREKYRDRILEARSVVE